MKPIDYPDNGRGLFVQYHRMREGPNYFLVCYKNSSVLRQDPKDACISPKNRFPVIEMVNHFINIER